MGTLRKYIIAGLLVWVPLAATIVIISFVIDVLDGTILLLPPEYRPEAVLGFSIPGFGVVFAIAILLLTGMLAANLLGRRLVALWEAILSRIPLVRNIYNSAKQITTTLLTSEGRSFRKVVLVEFPRKGLWSMGFLTNQKIGMNRDVPGSDMIAVFVPTTPNPTTGFLIMVSRPEIIELEMSVEDSFKYIISMGVVAPEFTKTAVKDTNTVAKQGAGS